MCGCTSKSRFAELDESHPLVQAGTPMHGRNLFPDDLPEFRRTVLDYLVAITRLEHRLMEGLALSQEEMNLLWVETLSLFSLQANLFRMVSKFRS